MTIAKLKPIRFLLMSAILTAVSLLLFQPALHAESKSHGAAKKPAAGGHGGAAKPAAAAKEHGAKKAAHGSGEKKSAHASKGDSKKGGHDSKVKNHGDDHGSHGSASNAEKLDPTLTKPINVKVVLALDASRSMQRSDPENWRYQGAKLFLRLLNEGDEVAIVKFDAESRLVSDFVKISPQTLPSLDGAIDEIPAEGNFTDLELPVAQALTMLAGGAVKSQPKFVVLLSDGKMDPHPEQGDAQGKTTKVLGEHLVKYAERGISLFSIGLGPEADAALLAKMSRATAGQSWSAVDASTTPQRFSELALELKRSVAAGGAKSGFKIEEGLKEVTFFVRTADSRRASTTHEPAPESGAEHGVTHTVPQSEGAGDVTAVTNSATADPTEIVEDTTALSRPEVVLVNPEGQEYSLMRLPVSIKWFHSDRFELITVSKPMNGRWHVRGVADPKRAVTVLNDLSLEVEPLGENVAVGESAHLFARLVNHGAPVEIPELLQSAIVQFRLYPAEGERQLSSGDFSLVAVANTLSAGLLPASADHHSSHSSTKVFQATVDCKEPGRGKVVASFTLPTLSVFGQTLLNVKESKVVLNRFAPSPFSHDPVGVLATLARSSGLGKPGHLTLQAKDKESGEVTTVKIDRSKSDPYQFLARFVELPLVQGEYELSIVTSVDEKQRQVELVRSNIVGYVQPASVESQRILIEKAEARTTVSGMICFGLAAVVVFLFGLYSLRGAGAGAAQPQGAEFTQIFELPQELFTQLELVKSRVGLKRRPATSDDLKLFAGVADLFTKEIVDLEEHAVPSDKVLDTEGRSSSPASGGEPPPSTGATEASATKAETTEPQQAGGEAHPA